MLIYIKRDDKVSYLNQESNMNLVPDLRAIRLMSSHDDETRDCIRCIDLSQYLGQEGVWVIENKEGKELGRAYDPDIFRIFGSIPPQYKDFYDEEGNFSEQLFKLNYKAA